MYVKDAFVIQSDRLTHSPGQDVTKDVTQTIVRGSSLSLNAYCWQSQPCSIWLAVAERRAVTLPLVLFATARGQMMGYARVYRGALTATNLKIRQGLIQTPRSRHTIRLSGVLIQQYQPT